MPSVDINANTRQAQANIKDLSKALDSTADALDDVADEGKQAGDKLERSFRDMVREAGKAEKAVEQIGPSAKGGMSKAGEATQEFKQEAAANFSEVTSSFDGSMSSVQDLAQGTLGGLASAGLPGVSIAAGIAAVGIGGISAALGNVEADRKALEERANDLAQAYIDAGSTVLDALAVADRTASILTDPEQRKGAEELAKALGGDLSLAVRLLAGDSAALAEAQTQAAAAQEYLDSLTGQQIANTGKRKTEIATEVEQYEKLIDAVAEQTDVQKQAAETARVQSDIYLALINSAEGVTKQVDALGNELYTMPDGKEILVAADTRMATANVEAFKGDVDELAEAVTTTVYFKGDTSDADAKFSALQRRANRGVDIAFNSTGRMTWE